jgi:hypothetical protein
MLFSDRSIWTMIHGIVLGGTFLVLFSAAIYCMWNLDGEKMSSGLLQKQCRSLSRLTIAMAVVLWLMVIVGTFIAFPSYSVSPPAGTEDLSAYPEALLKSVAENRWLHSIGMEVKEHMPWIPAMLMTGIAFITTRYRTGFVANAGLRSRVLALSVLVGGVVGLVALFGIFINKVAPLM